MENQLSNAPSSSLAGVPRAVWIGGALLALVTAGLAGALVMRSTQPTTAPLASDGANSAQVAPVVPAPVTAAAPAQAPVPPAPVAAATPPRAHHTPRTESSGTTTADASGGSTWRPAGETTPVAVCATCGVVESVTPVQVKGQGTGLGAVAGGVLGGVVGHQVGGGGGRTALTVLGALGGGLAGNEVEKRTRSTTVYNVQVRMDDGSSRTIQRATAMEVGTHVTVDGQTLSVAPSSGSDPNRMLRTSSPSGSGS